LAYGKPVTQRLASRGGNLFSAQVSGGRLRGNLTKTAQRSWGNLVGRKWQFIVPANLLYNFELRVTNSPQKFRERIFVPHIRISGHIRGHSISAGLARGTCARAVIGKTGGGRGVGIWICDKIGAVTWLNRPPLCRLYLCRCFTDPPCLPGKQYESKTK
jgi:hypothetical protein